MSSKWSRMPTTSAKPRRLGFVLAAGGAAAVLAVAVAAPFIAPSRPMDASMCPVSGAIAGHTILLVDATDAYDAGQIARLRAAATAAIGDVPKGGRLTLMTVDADNPWQPREVFSLCNPGDGSGAMGIVVTPSVLRAQWKHRFVDRVEQQAQALAAAPTAEHSPLLESVAALVGRRDFGADTPNRRLIYVTDGIENEPGYSQYGLNDPKRAYERSPLASQIDADFSGVKVELEYLRRPSAGTVQGSVHKAFWRWFFRQHGAKDVTIRGA